MTALTQTQQAWDTYFEQHAYKNEGLYWYNAGPDIFVHRNIPFSGQANVDWAEHICATYFAGKPVERCLSLGCGAGRLERQLAKLNAFVACDAYDVAAGAVAQAKREAARAGYNHIHYGARDINTIELPAATYNAVWVSAAMHHFANLEHVCAQIAQSLKPGGLLLLDEYVGGNHLQCSERQKELANLCLQLLPERYRVIVAPPAVYAEGAAYHNTRKGIGWYASRLRDKLLDGTLLDAIRRRSMRGNSDRIKRVVNFPTARDVIAVDPSEAVRSADIMPVVSQHFDILQNVGWGGNIIQFLLADIAGNFAHGDEHAAAYLRLILAIERNVIDCGELAADFAYIVARRKAG